MKLEIKLYILILVLITACYWNNSSYDLNEQLVENIVEDCISQDFFTNTDTISYKLLPYSLYESRFTEDGLEVPPPFNPMKGELTYLKKLLNTIDSEEHFNEKIDGDFILQQLYNSKCICDTLRLNEQKFSKNKSEKFYILYQPIFNSSYSAVYLQYDFYDHIYGNGGALLLVKESENWIIIKKYFRWIS